MAAPLGRGRSRSPAAGAVSDAKRTRDPCDLRAPTTTTSDHESGPRPSLDYVAHRFKRFSRIELRGERLGSVGRLAPSLAHTGVCRCGPAPAPRGPGSGDAIAAPRRLPPRRARRGAGEGDAARSVTALLLDASVLLAAFDPEDDHHESAQALLEDEDASLATLDFARYEVANVAVRACRAPESVGPLLAAVERLGDDGGVALSTDTLLTKAAEIAERHTISVYDAAYVAAAEVTAAIALSAATSATWSPRVLRPSLRTHDRDSTAARCEPAADLGARTRRATAELCPQSR